MRFHSSNCLKGNSFSQEPFYWRERPQQTMVTQSCFLWTTRCFLFNTRFPKGQVPGSAFQSDYLSLNMENRREIVLWFCGQEIGFAPPPPPTHNIASPVLILPIRVWGCKPHWSNFKLDWSIISLFIRRLFIREALGSEGNTLACRISSQRLQGQQAVSRLPPHQQKHTQTPQGTCSVHS